MTKTEFLEEVVLTKGKKIKHQKKTTILHWQLRDMICTSEEGIIIS
jgi:hypothetical protein